VRGLKLARIPAVALALSGVIALATLVLQVRGASTMTPADDFGLTGFGGLAFVIASLAFAATGAIVATRLPRNPIGWIFCFMGLLIGVGNLPFQYADVALYIEPGLPGGDAAAVIQNLGFTPCFGLLAFALLLFPDGRLPSRRWRPAAVAALLGSTLLGWGYALRPGRLDPPFHQIRNPFGVGTFELMDGLTGVGWMLSALGAAFAAAAIIVRYRRSSGSERQQLKWIALAGAGIGILLVANFFSFAFDVQGIDELRLVLVGLAFTSLPIAAGIAILRYRLYDIDVVINRALVYAGLTATLAVVYVVSVLVLQLAFNGITGDSGLAVAGSTLAVAAAFRPARTRIQEAVDQRFFRSRYDARQTLEAFSSRLRDQVDLAALDAELRGVVAETMRPAHLSVWLREAPR
jgi:hypothetical protein